MLQIIGLEKDGFGNTTIAGIAVQLFDSRVQKQDVQVCSELRDMAEKVVKESSGCQEQLNLLAILCHVLTIVGEAKQVFPVGSF